LFLDRGGPLALMTGTLCYHDYDPR